MLGCWSLSTKCFREHIITSDNIVSVLAIMRSVSCVGDTVSTKMRTEKHTHLYRARNKLFSCSILCNRFFKIAPHQRILHDFQEEYN